VSIRPVFIGASWCAPCKHVRPLFAKAVSDAGLEAEYIDVDESPDVRTTGVMMVPTVRVYAADDPFGDVLAEHRGYATLAQLRALLERGQALV